MMRTGLAGNCCAVEGAETNTHVATAATAAAHLFITAPFD
jgi:hypothetical protein